MALIKFEVRDCLVKSSPKCTQTFKRELKRGRPPVACSECKKAPVVKVATEGKAEAVEINTERDCPCGNKFHIKLGRGRKATKCDTCREAGTVYRMNEDGELDAIRAEALAEEAREKAEAAGRERAGRLIEMMKPLIERDERRRKAIAG